MRVATEELEHARADAEREKLAAQKREAKAAPDDTPAEQERVPERVDRT